MKRYMLFGAHPNGGGWGNYVESYDTEKQAQKAAVYWLNRGYDAFVYDWTSETQYELVSRYDGLGIS